MDNVRIGNIRFTVEEAKSFFNLVEKEVEATPPAQAGFIGEVIDFSMRFEKNLRKEVVTEVLLHLSDEAYSNFIKQLTVCTIYDGWWGTTVMCGNPEWVKTHLGFNTAVEILCKDFPVL